MDDTLFTASILVVGIRREYRRCIEAILTSPELELVFADSPDDALMKTGAHNFALVLLDGKADGVAVEQAAALRSDHRSRTLPIIMVAVAAEESLKVFKGQDLAFVEYLMEPVLPYLLQGKVGILVELSRQRRQLEAKSKELEDKDLELEVLLKELDEKNERLEGLSSLDGLTGLFNRRYFDDNLTKEWKQAMRTRTTLSLLLVEVDSFRTYAEFYGRMEGDECLCKVAAGLYDALLRPIDIIARYGAEMFAVILPDTDRRGVELVALRMMEHIAGLEIANQTAPGGMVTISLGAATMKPVGDSAATTFFDHAALALQEARVIKGNSLRLWLQDKT